MNPPPFSSDLTCGIMNKLEAASCRQTSKNKALI